MHRAFSLPRWIGCLSLVLSLVLHVGIKPVSAQGGLNLPTNQRSGDQISVIELGVGSSRAHAMSSRTQLKRVENPNSNIVRVEKLPNSSTEVMLVGVSPGRTLVTFTDQNDRVEHHEFVVAAPAAPPAAPAAPVPVVHVAQGKEVGVVQITIQLPELKSKPIPSQLILQGKSVTIHSSNERVVVPEVQGKTLLARTTGIPGVVTVTVTDGKITETFEIIVVAGIDDLQRTINRLVPTGSISVVVDERTNTRVVTGTVLTPDDARLVQQVAGQAGAISNIKIGGAQQVQLEVLIAVVNRSEARNMSFSFTQNGTNWFISSLFGGPFTTGSALATGIAASTAGITPVPATANVPFGIINNNNSFISFLQCLRTENLAKIMAEPRIVTLSGRPAYIVSGGETPLLTSSGQGAPSISYKQFGTVVNFLPIVLGNGKIHLEVRPELSDIDNTIGISIPGVTPTIVPGFRTRSAQVAVQIEDGQTLAIGGLIQNTINASITRVPVLGDLPGLGTLFSQKSYTEQEQELIILVTPRLIDPIDCTRIPKYLPGRETRSPDDFEFFLEGILEAPRGPRNVQLRPRYYQPAFHGASNINQIPCGDGFGRGDCRDGNCAPGYANNRSPFTPGMQAYRPQSNFPNDLQALPVSNSRYTGEAELTTVPALREAVPSLGPIVPTSPLPPSREYDMPRPVLPPSSR